MKKADIAAKLKGKGIYIAIAACVVIIGGAGILAYNKAVKDIGESITTIPPQTPQNNYSINSNGNSDTDKDNSEDKTILNTSLNIGEQLQAAVEVQPNFMPIANGTVINPFSNGDLVRSETLNVWKTHDGVDIAAPLGTEVKAMTKGVVTDIYDDAMWGNCIVIDHGNGITGYYCNLSKAMTVKEGDNVDAGDVISSVGDSADAEIAMESHLHFALKQNNEWIDPIEYIEPSAK